LFLFICLLIEGGWLMTIALEERIKGTRGARKKRPTWQFPIGGIKIIVFCTGCSLPYFHKEKTGNHVFLNSYWLFPFWANFSSILIGYFLFGPIFLL
jgi:hypothetical protein